MVASIVCFLASRWRKSIAFLPGESYRKRVGAEIRSTQYRRGPNILDPHKEIQTPLFRATSKLKLKKFRINVLKSTIFELEQSFKYIFGVAENL